MRTLSPPRDAGNPLSAIPVSMVPNGKSVITADVPIVDIIARIRSGDWSKQCREIRKVFHAAEARGESGKDAAAPLKLKLPGILWSGQFSKRNVDLLIEHSGLLCADLDHLPPERIAETHDQLRADPHIVTAFVSPTGTGLKAVVRVPTDAKKHGASFRAVRSYFKTTYGLPIDEACKDVSRLCFASYDPAAWIHPDATTLEVTDDPPVVQPKPAAGAPVTSKGTLPPTVEQRIASGAPEGQRDAECFAIACQLRDAGRSESEAERRVLEFAARCSPPFPEKEAIEKVRSAYKKAPRGPAIGQTPRFKPGTAAADYLGTEAPEHSISIDERIAGLWFDPQEPPPDEPVLVTIAGTPCATRGNITTITAQKKSGKTAFLSALAAAPISERGDTLGVKAFNPENKTVLHFDTEQSAMDHWKICDSILRRAQLTESAIFKSVCLTSLPILERRAVVHHVIRQEAQRGNGVFIALIDGHGDLVRNVNDPEETADYIAALHALAIETRCHIYGALHLNPGSDYKSRGHLGSELERKSQTNLRLEKGR